MSKILDQYVNSPATREAVKTLAANLQFVSLDKPLKNIVITSAIPNEGKTSIAHWLALALAESGKRILLLDADLRKPSKGKHFQCAMHSGLNTLLAQESPNIYDIEAALTSTQRENLFFLGAEYTNALPVEALQSKRFDSIYDALCQIFDSIIIDTPPVGQFVDAAVLGAKMDACLLVVSNNKVRRDVAAQALEQLRKANANVVGAVLNFSENMRSEYYYNHYYSKASTQPSATTAKPQPTRSRRSK